MIKEKVLIVAPCPVPSNRGTPAAILRKAEALSCYFLVEILTYPIYDKKILYDKNIKIHRVKNYVNLKDISSGPSFKKIFLDVFLFFKLITLYKKEQYNHVIFEHYEGSFIGFFFSVFLKNNKTSLIYSAHAGLIDEIQKYNFLNHAFFAQFWKFLEKGLSSYPEKIMTVSMSLKDYIVEKYKYNIKNIEYIPMCIDVPQKLELLDFDKNIFFKKNSYNIVYTGSLAIFQNLDSLIPIASKMDKKFIFYVVCGDEKQSDIIDFNLKIKENVLEDKIILLPNKTLYEMYLIMNEADLLISLRTDCPGMPLKILNYMTIGKPIMIFEGSAAGVLNKSNSVIIENNNYNRFAEKILYISENQMLAKKIALKAKNDSHVFSKEEVSKKLYSFLKKSI
jgi:glycosyltransferase involved in cell wall biosynthesis